MAVEPRKAALSPDEDQPEVEIREHRNIGHSLYQGAFFFCTVMNVGDMDGTGCIYVETVVDSTSGCTFAKVYSTKNAMNAVDVLSARVIPFFKRAGFTVKEIYTRKTHEYCGLVPLHPYETFLFTSSIQHSYTDLPGKPYNYLCTKFYRFLQKEFFQPELRKKFNLTLGELQKDLDAFLERYNAVQLKHLAESMDESSPPSNFPVDL